VLRAAGYQTYLPDERLRSLLRNIGCDLVLSPRDLTRSMGYDPVDLPEAGPEAMDSCDLYCDVKAHKDYDKIVARWPRLQGRVLWTRINGGRPEIVPGCGDELDPPCPVLTANLWYRLPRDATSPNELRMTEAQLVKLIPCVGQGRAYACWPPFVRFRDYMDRHGRVSGVETKYTDPLCLIHGVSGWGYGRLLDGVRKLGVRVYGRGSPDGLIPHAQVPLELSKALAYVHLKSSDAPGYSLYEALAAGCPVVCTRRLIWRCRMGDLFTPGETCYVFDHETHEGLTDRDVEDCLAELTDALQRLRSPAENQRVGLSGRRRLQEVMWREDRDGDGLRAFFARNFPA
jgi:hypothetical protein